MKPTILCPGDICFSCGDSKVSKLIRWFTRDKGEPKTEANHTFNVSKGGLISEAEITEAVATVQRGSLILRYGPPRKDRVAIFRPIGLTPEQREVVVRATSEYLNRRYGYVKIAAHALDRLIGGKYVFRRIAGMADYPICSWLVAYSFEKAGVSFGVPVDKATPDDIWDWVVAHPRKFKQIRPMTPLWEA